MVCKQYRFRPETKSNRVVTFPRKLVAIGRSGATGLRHEHAPGSGSMPTVPVNLIILPLFEGYDPLRLTAIVLDSLIDVFLVTGHASLATHHRFSIGRSFAGRL
jgi:hypothetical protein